MRSVLSEEDLRIIHAKEKMKKELRENVAFKVEVETKKVSALEEKTDDLGKETQTKTENKSTDDYLGQVVKFIPAEVVAFYVAAFGLFASAKEGTPIETLAWITFGVGFAGTIVYTFLVGKKDKVPNVLLKTVFGVIGFVIWAYTLGGPFAPYSWYNSLYGSFGILVFLFGIPAVYKLIATQQANSILKAKA